MAKDKAEKALAEALRAERARQVIAAAQAEKRKGENPATALQKALGK